MSDNHSQPGESRSRESGVSVIIPAHNAADTLAATLESLRAQQYENWEAIVVDDGSTDGTAVRARHYARLDGRIRVCMQKRGGEAAARNRGISLGRCAWLLFLDADDTIAPDHMQRLMAALAADSSLDGAYCDWVRVAPDGTRGDIEYAPEPDVLFAVAARHCPFAIHACIVRRRLVDEIGRFDTALTTCPDWDLWQRVARTGRRMARVAGPLAFYWMRSGSAGGRALQVLADAWAVIDRGHRADPRVRRPHPRFANGADANQRDAAKSLFLCWVAGLLIGQGSRAEFLVFRLDAVRQQRIDADSAVDVLILAPLLPGCHTSSAWPSLWPGVRGRLRDFLTALGKATSAPDLCAEVEQRMEARIVTVRAEKREHPAIRHSPIRKAVTHVGSARLSVLMVVGNAERFIAEAIESVIRQTSDEWELLLIEHGSGDCSPTIAARYERAGGGRVRCLHYDGGEGESADAIWHWALQRARGEFVARLDPDHVWSADVVREFVAALDSTPGALAARAPSARGQGSCDGGPAERVPPGRPDTRVNGAPAGHDRPCGSTLAARRVELLQMTTRTGPHADAISTLDPRIRLSSQHGSVVTDSGRVECRVRDAMSGCGGLLLTTMPPGLALRARSNGDRVAMSPGDGMPISVVICTRDRPAHIGACLEAVLAQTHSAGEVIVIEDAPSSDEAARLIRHYPVRHRTEAKPGLSHARNLGLACARFDVIAFTDDDARPDPDWLRSITHAFADPQVMAVTGLVLPATLETPAQSLFEHACGGMGKGAKPIQYAGASMSLPARMAVERLGVGANMAFRRAAFDRVGLFDPMLGAGSPGRSAEDLDMFHRIVAAGLTLRYEPSAIVRHHHRAEMDDLVRQLDDAAYGYARYLEKLCTGVTVPGRSASLFRARWYAWMIGRVVLGSLGLKDVPTALLRSQLQCALAARRTTAPVAALTAPLSEHDIVTATGVR